MNAKKFFHICLTMLFLLPLSSVEVFGLSRYAVIGASEATGLYYVTGGMLSKLLDKNRKKHGIGLSVEITKGSVYNIDAVLKGKLDFGLVQSDCQYKAYHALSGSPWGEEAPKKKIRSLFALYSESVTLVAPVRTGITKVGDLIDLKVNLGGFGSGPLESARDILVAFGLSEDMLHPRYFKMSKVINFLQDGGVSAFFYTVGHPAKLIRKASEMKLKNRLVEISGPSVEMLLHKYPYYSKTSIPISLYPGFANKTDVLTVGVKAVLFASENMDADLVYALTQEVFENLDHFKTLHRAYESLTRQNMLEGVSAPFHEGALRYYEEAGLIGGKTKKKKAETEVGAKTKEKVKTNKPSAPILSF